MFKGCEQSTKGAVHCSTSFNTKYPVIAEVRDGRLQFKNNFNTWRFIGIVKGSAR